MRPMQHTHPMRSMQDYDGNPVDIKEHQDAYEFFTRLQACEQLGFYVNLM